MKQLGKKAWSEAPLLVLVMGVLLQAGCSKSSEPVTIRLAGDEWFLKSLTKTGLIAGYEEKAGVHVEVLDRNDRKIMNDLGQKIMEVITKYCAQNSIAMVVKHMSGNMLSRWQDFRLSGGESL